MIRIARCKFLKLSQQGLGGLPDFVMNRRVIGAGFSVLIHILFVSGVYSLGAFLPSFKSSLVIDFRIQSGGGAGMELQKKSHNVDKPLSRKTVRKAQVVKTFQKQRIMRERKEITPHVRKKAFAPKKETQPPAVQPVHEKKIKERAVAGRPVARTVEREEIAAAKNHQAVSEEVESRENAEVLGANNANLRSSATKPGGDGKSGSIFAKKQYMKEYFLYIKEGIQRKICYPRIARKKGWEGKVVVSFVVCEDGYVRDMQVVESSGFPLLDKNAVTTIRQAAPFPKPPVRAELIVPVVYRLRPSV